MKGKALFLIVAIFQCFVLQAQWEEDGQNIFYNNAGFAVGSPKGKVGIGWEDPERILDVFDWGSAYLRVRSRALFAGSNQPYTSGLELMGSNTGSSSMWRIYNSGGTLFFHNPDTHFRFHFGGDVAQMGIGNLPIQFRIFGPENTGNKAALKIASTDQVMYLDGNEIDGVTHGLYLNNNTNKNVYLATGGGNVSVGDASASTKLDVDGWLTVGHKGDNSQIFLNAANNQKARIGVQDDGGRGFYIMTNNKYRMNVNQAGKVGIGTQTPSAKLEVRHNAETGNPHLELVETDASDVTRIYMKNAGSSNYFALGANPGADDPYFNFTFNNGSSSTRIMRIDGDNHRVGIGNNISEIPAGYRLAVDGKIRCREVRVTNSGWADFVFEDDYQLPSLSEVEQFIKTNKHLPDVPSASEVLENGTDLGEIDAILLQKIEELTLYMIELKKENEEMKAQLEQFNKNK